MNNHRFSTHISYNVVEIPKDRIDQVLLFMLIMRSMVTDIIELREKVSERRGVVFIDPQGGGRRINILFNNRVQNT